MDKEHFDILNESQNNNLLKIAPKLRSNNINQQGFENTRVGISSNLMNNSVSAALKFMSNDEVDFTPTATFVSVIDQWFGKKTSRHYLKAFSLAKQAEHIEY